MKAASKATSNGGNVDSREALREMLSELRKDAMDDDVMDDNSGAFFPCEFCGDPYPVEYIMRHQVRKVYHFHLFSLQAVFLFCSWHVI